MNTAVLEEMQEKLCRAQCVSAVNKLIGKFCQLYPRSKGEALLELFAVRQDSRVEMLWGVYDGYDSICRCFTIAHPKPEEIERRENEMHVSNAMSVVIVPADDGLTARATWQSYGHSSGKTEKRAMDGYWSLRNYGADFIFENGQWKFWHLHIYDIFLCDFYTSWTDGAEQRPDSQVFFNYFRPTGEGAPDREPTVTWHYNKNAVYSQGCPAVPTPYKTFASIGYGY
ncbi:MAG: nuclear transport factor 2 family protein [Oscillospiraceae bacterium]|nr:nuclear transport factor 2 family protein [Oscillospiraceae bacterium]